MTPVWLLRHGIVPALELLPPAMDTPGARLQLLATAIQETGLKYRQQIGGPALSFYQLEKNQAVLNVFVHDRTMGLLHAACEALAVPFNLDAVAAAVVYHDVLASVVARLQYWLSLLAVPAVGDAAAALAMYADVWRPAWSLNGAPEPGRWDAAYTSSQAAVASSPVA